MTICFANNANKVNNNTIESENKNIVNLKNYVDKQVFTKYKNNNYITKQKICTIKQNSENFEIESLEKLFTSANVKNKLVQAIIDAKVKSLENLSPEILK